MRARFILVAFLLTLQACSTSSTGRSQLKLFSPGQLAQLGTQAFDTMKADIPLSTAPDANERVQCVVNALLPHVQGRDDGVVWETQVFESDEFNAFALPGGKIGVYTGLLKVADTPDKLAAVIGHEIAHVIEEHGNERMSRSTLVNIGLEITATALSARSVGEQQTIMAALGIGAQVGLQLPFSRDHELEADLVGLQLMAQAGFDPQAAITLWQNVAEKQAQRSPEWLSTHPLPSTRIEALQQAVNDVKISTPKRGPSEC